MPDLGYVQKAILAHLDSDVSGLIFEGMRPVWQLRGIPWPKVEDSLQRLLRRGILVRIDGTQHCYRRKQ
jgi:hypothetical protein